MDDNTVFEDTKITIPYLDFKCMEGDIEDYEFLKKELKSCFRKTETRDSLGNFCEYKDEYLELVDVEKLNRIMKSVMRGKCFREG